MITHYLDAGNNERLWDEHRDLTGGGFDYEEAGARLLGRDIAAIASPPTREQLVDLLGNELSEDSGYRFLIQIERRGREHRSFERILALLQSVKRGLEETLG